MKKIPGGIAISIALVLVIASVQAAAERRASTAASTSASTLTPSPAILPGTPLPGPSLILVEFFAGF